MKKSVTYTQRILTVVALAGMMVAGPVVRGQDKPAATPAPAGDTTTAAPKVTRAKQMEAFFADAKVTEDQKTQIKAALKDELAKTKSAREDTSLTPKERRTANQATREATQAKIKGILSPEQFTQWQAFQKKQAAGRGKKAGQPAPAATTTPQQ
jgi:protein CpxP